MKVIPTSFTRVEMTPEEQATGAVLTSLNHAVIQNMIADIAEEKLALKFTPNDIHTYTQQEAHLAGQLDILKYLLDCSLSMQKSHSL
jgi:hypothetical protein